MLNRRPEAPTPNASDALVLIVTPVVLSMILNWALITWNIEAVYRDMPQVAVVAYADFAQQFPADAPKAAVAAAYRQLQERIDTLTQNGFVVLTDQAAVGYPKHLAVPLPNRSTEAHSP